ncbi:uncharacterized protein VNE69_01060 [Vairimorpha necatrix]|uniref:Uncharacterized protein n=1 Tax=Vairimorpha necatrix TaxID=6039 RepID=A0AAX4J7Y4_9MICR
MQLERGGFVWKNKKLDVNCIESLEGKGIEEVERTNKIPSEMGNFELIEYINTSIVYKNESLKLRVKSTWKENIAKKIYMCDKKLNS